MFICFIFHDYKNIIYKITSNSFRLKRNCNDTNLNNIIYDNKINEGEIDKFQVPGPLRPEKIYCQENYPLRPTY